jgi:hypothetical protein
MSPPALRTSPNLPEHVPTDPADEPEPALDVLVETVNEPTGTVQPEDGSPDGIESDDDASEAPNVDDEPQDATIGSFDTAPIIVTDRTGEINATEDMCRLILSSRSPDGLVIFCGNPADLCAQRTHQVKQAGGSECAAPGVYEGVLNASKKVVDGILETFVSFEEREERTQENLRAMEESIYERSAQKKQTEAALPSALKTPSTISFKLDDPPLSEEASRREHMPLGVMLSLRRPRSPTHLCRQKDKPTFVNPVKSQEPKLQHRPLFQARSRPTRQSLPRVPHRLKIYSWPR